MGNIVIIRRRLALIRQGGFELERVHVHSNSQDPCSGPHESRNKTALIHRCHANRRPCYCMWDPFSDALVGALLWRESNGSSIEKDGVSAMYATQRNGDLRNLFWFKIATSTKLPWI